MLLIRFKTLAWISGLLLDWFSYLSDMTFCVKVSKFSSNTPFLTSEVLQGSVMG